MGVEAIGKLIDESTAVELSGQQSSTIEQAREALNLALSEGTSDDIASAQIRLGDLHYRMGHFKEAKRLGEEALLHSGDESRARVEAYLLLGNCSMEVSTLDEPEGFYQAAADLSRQIGYDQALVRAVHDLGACIYAMRGQFTLAFAAEEEAYRISSHMNLGLQPVMLISMCFDCLLTGQYQRASELLLSLEPLIKNNYSFQGYFNVLNALIAQFDGNLPEAFEFYELARIVAGITGDLGLNIFLRIGLSGYYQTMGNYSAAYDWANDAVAWAVRLGTKRMQGRAWIERGYAAWLNGDRTSAENDLRLAIDVLQQRQQAYDLARAQLLLAAVLQQQSQAEAESAYLEAITLILSGDFTYLLERERACIFPLIAHYLNSDDASMQAINNRLLARFKSLPAPPLQIKTLGCFEVYRRGIPIPKNAWRRQAGELFRLLLTSPSRTLSREHISEALWPDKAQSTTRVNFHQATSSLRRALEPDLPDKFPSRYLIVKEGQVTLYLPIGSLVDYEAFEMHVYNGEWEQSLELYQGEPFIKDRYSDWAAWKREELIQLSLKALLGAANDKLEAGLADQALAACLRVLNEEPWNEQAVMLGMLAYQKMNNRPAALRLYKNLERCLRNEFDLSPMQELINLHKALEAVH